MTIAACQKWLVRYGASKASTEKMKWKTVSNRKARLGFKLTKIKISELSITPATPKASIVPIYFLKDYP